MPSLWRRIERAWLVNSSRAHLREINRRFAERIPAGALVLDAGAGEAPYRDLFTHARYESADFEKVDKAYHASTYVCDLASIPVADERFDAVLFNQVFEHVPEPLTVLKELHRVLRPGGRILCTCPLFYEEHEAPYDFYRYTQFAHRHLFEEAGLDIDRLEWVEGYFGTIGYQLALMWRKLPATRPEGAPRTWWALLPFLWLVKVSAFVLAGLFYRMDLRFQYTGGGLPKNYLVVATKRPSPG